MTNEVAIVEVEAMPLSLVEQETRAEIDLLFTVSKKYPRSLEHFRQRATELATYDQETAESCYYSLPRGGKTVNGETIRLAEICAHAYGNLRYGARIIEEHDRFAVAQGKCWDLENITEVTITVRRRLTDKNGRRYAEHVIESTLQAAISIALRNAIFRVIPKALVKPIYDAAVKCAVGTVAALPSRRHTMVEKFAGIGVEVEQVLKHVKAARLEDVGLKEMETLIGIYNAIRDKEATVDEIFGAKPEDEQAQGKGMSELKKKVAKKKAAKKKEAAAAPEPELPDPAAVKSNVSMPEGAEDAFPEE